MATIAGLTGRQFLPNSPEYPLWQWQYATSTFLTAHDMRPGLIVQPANKTDIKRVIAYAKAHGRAIAIRTGGHHYTGASSTGPANIQLDLRSTFQAPEDLVYFEKDGKSFVRASVSHSVGAFNEFLGEHHAFVPHGQCRQVFLGGHLQRAFGLLGDHIRVLEIIDCDGRERTITRRSESELFFAWLGGSPGNLGVLTHVLMEVYRDSDYNGAIGMRAVHRYTAEKLRTVLGYLAEVSDDDNFPRNYDLCIGVLSSPEGIDDGIDVYMREEHPEIFGEDGFPSWPRSMIMIYAQYVPFSPNDKPDMDFFERLRKGCFMANPLEETPMSELTAQWIFQNRREFDLPFAKRTYSTRSTTLATNGWVDWVVGRIDEIARGSPENGQWVSAQVQCLEGNTLSYVKVLVPSPFAEPSQWRDTTMAMTIDNFHKPEKRAEAEAWEAINDRESLGPDGIFSQHDRRLLWGTWGSFDLDSVWHTYYEDRRKYERLMRARSRADPHGTFTPNSFCVKRAEVSVLSAL
ncbi:hypothetical protein FB45DRAFT_982079 [Roridomyces roridus]|uniref:FAD-binding PCMH-type domain-containing protein n=1 Tax=Roridomyces roridus TaxID=1738132 RepID=A0AAD7B6G7_9AGAR|nr:hypothetical protein FB45DRAFT_982079 [Roridomyces roridus]